MTRVLVTGGRTYSRQTTLYAALDAVHKTTPISCIIEGGATGADWLASMWSVTRDIPDHRRFRADWALHGKGAGPIRNGKMIREGKPDLVIAFPGGAGTADCVRQARAAGIEVREIGTGGSERRKEGRIGWKSGSQSMR